MEQSARRERGRTVATGAVLPAFAPEIPHRSEHDIGIRGVDCQVCATGRKIRSLEDLLPCLAAIGRFVQTAFRRIAPQGARNRSEYRIAVCRANFDLRNALGFLQASPRPRFTTIGRLIDSLANGQAVARPRLTSADQHVFRIFRIERDGADRLTALCAESRAVPLTTS